MSHPWPRSGRMRALFRADRSFAIEASVQKVDFGFSLRARWTVTTAVDLEMKTPKNRIFPVARSKRQKVVKVLQIDIR